MALAVPWVTGSRTKILPKAAEVVPPAPFPTKSAAQGRRRWVGVSLVCVAGRAASPIQRDPLWFPVVQRLLLRLQLWDCGLPETLVKNVVERGIFKTEAVSEEVISKI